MISRASISNGQCCILIHSVAAYHAFIRQGERSMKHELKPLTVPLRKIVARGAFLLAAGISIASIPAHAGVDVSIGIGVPPPPRVEVVPAAPAGYVWAPGYWDFFQGQYVWRRGHFQQGRPGYRWVPETWERRGDVHHFNEGHWDRDPDYHRGRDHDDHHR
jgi:hypothetical protein